MSLYCWPGGTQEATDMGEARSEYHHILSISVEHAGPEISQEATNRLERHSRYNHLFAWCE